MAPKRKQTGMFAENGRSKQSSPGPSKGKQHRRREKENGTTSGTMPVDNRGTSWSYLALVMVLATTCGVIHRNHIAGMFESDRHFSHLSTLERELAFRTEMGLYFSYYKTILEAPSFAAGLHEIMFDNITEYPLTINTLKRFNLYPEVLLGGAYRMYSAVMSYMNIPIKMCWQVNRGDGKTPVQSCEGLGEPSYFYIESVFLLNGINMAVFFLFGTYLSGTVLGGLIAVLSFFYNHGECTRVQWTPPLRESFAYPFLVIQMFILTHTLRVPRPSYRHSLALGVATVCFMLPWQFAQFALMTQTVAVFGTYVLQFIDSHKLKVVLAGQALGLLVSFAFLFGNEMLLTSFFASCLLSVSLIVLLEPWIEKIKTRFLIWVTQGLLWLIGTVGLKIFLSRLLRVADDAHIGDIFKSKFLSFNNFHTMLYTCAAEFDFMERETPWRVLKTLLAPCAAVAVGIVAYRVLQNEYSQWLSQKKHQQHLTTESENNHQDHNGNGKLTEELASIESHIHSSDGTTRSKPHAELVYHLFQLVAFTAMAVIIMRLKLFWTPHLCLFTSMLASPKMFPTKDNRLIHWAVLGGVAALMSVQGIANMQHQWSIMGEFSNYPLEDVVEFINMKTPKNAVFAGPMPTMATVKLSTSRPIVNHPHYEDAGLRERTKKVYTMYSRKPEQEVWRNLIDLQVDYAILEESWCVRRSRPGCGLAEVWDLEDKENMDKIPVCARLYKNPGPYFTRVFRNQVYDILKVNKDIPKARR